MKLNALDTVRAKLARAKVHAKELGGHIASAEEACRGKPVPDWDFSKGEVSIRWHTEERFPLEWAAILGDYLHNWRSALDHIAWEMTGRYFDPDDRTKRRIFFPICLTESELARTIESRLPGIRINSGFGVAVDAVQPYRVNPEEPRSNVLWVLSRLNNVDKHRLLNLAERRLVHLDMKLSSLSASEEELPKLEAVQLESEVALRDGAEIARFKLADPTLVELLAEKQVVANLGISDRIVVGHGEVRDGDGEPMRGLAISEILELGTSYMENVVIPEFEHLWSFDVQLFKESGPD